MYHYSRVRVWQRRTGTGTCTSTRTGSVHFILCVLLLYWYEYKYMRQSVFFLFILPQSHLPSLIFLLISHSCTAAQIVVYTMDVAKSLTTSLATIPRNPLAVKPMTDFDLFRSICFFSICFTLLCQL
jgi:hypothetical protein